MWDELTEAPDAAAAEARVGKWMRTQARRLLEAALQAGVERQERVQGLCRGEHLAPHSRQPRQALTLFGTVRVSRSYRRCRQCGRSWMPADR